MLWSLQNLRFVAALLVVYVHSSKTAFIVTGSHGVLPQEFQLAGRAGVDIFFVLSGVIIARTSAGLHWKEFVWRRLRRIVPLYYIVCAFALLMALLNGTHFGWRGLLASFFLWPATDIMTEPLVKVAWTLTFETLFYAATALTLIDRRWFPVSVAIFIISVFLRPLSPVFQILGNPLIIEFLFGVALAHASASKIAVWGLPIGAIVIASAGFLDIAPTGGTLEFLRGEDGFQRILVYGIPAALVVYGTMQLQARQSFWTQQGDASYALYLTHPMLVAFLWSLWEKFPAQPDVIIIVDVFVASLFAWRFHVRFEKPLLDALKS